MNRIAEEVEAIRSTAPSSTRSAPSPRRPARRDRRRGAADRRDARSVGDHLLDLFRLDRRCASRASGRSRRSWRSRPTSPPGGGCRWSGACTASSPRTRATRTTWWTAPAASPFKDGFAKAGQRVIIVAGVPLGTPGATNMLRIASRPRARASITPTARSASSVTVCTASRSLGRIVEIVRRQRPDQRFMQRAEQRGRRERGVLRRQMPGAHRGVDPPAISPAISRRLASRDAVTSTSTGSARMPQASLRCDSTCTATVVTAAASAEDGPGAASAARRIAPVHRARRRRSVRKSDRPWRGNSGRRCRRRHWRGLRPARSAPPPCRLPPPEWRPAPPPGCALRRAASRFTT
jgi:hypothetical protein